MHELEYARCDIPTNHTHRRTGRSYLGDIIRACRSAVFAIYVCFYDGIGKMGQYRIDDKPREWQRVSDQARSPRATSIIRRRSIAQRRAGARSGIVQLSIGIGGLIISMFSEMPTADQYILAGAVLGIEGLSIIYERCF
jgi:hypothetical protein